MNIAEFIAILWARKWIVLVTLATVVAATAAVSLSLPKRYTATTSLVLDFRGTDPVTGLVSPAQMIPASYLATQLEIISSHNVALKVVDSLKLTDNPFVKKQFMAATQGQGSIRDWLADLLLKSLKVKSSTESNVVNIQYKGNDPQFVAAMANAFAQAYIRTNLELRVEPAKETAAWFDGQIRGLRNNLEKAQARLSRYQQAKGIVANDNQLDVEDARLAELSSQLVAAEGQTYDSLSKQRQLQAELAKGQPADTLPEIMSNPLVQGLKGRLAGAEAKFAEVAERVEKNHPKYQQTEAEVDSLKQKLATEIQKAIDSVNNAARIAQQREGELRAAVAAQKKRVLALKQKRDDLAVLARDVDNAKRSYDAAMQRLGQTSLESQTTQTNIAVLNRAVAPLQPSGPKVLLNVLVATFLGTLMGVGLAFAAEFADRRVRSADDLAAALDLPVLARLDPPGGKGKLDWLRRIFRPFLRLNPA